MKKLAKTLMLLMLASIMLLCAACGDNTDPTTTAPKDSSFDKYPANFSDWTLAEMKTYLKDRNVTANESFLSMDLTAGDLGAMKAVAGTMYMDIEAGSVVDIYFHYDLNNAEQKAVYDGILANKVLAINGDMETAQAIDAVVGHFCFQYLTGYDEEHINALTQALKDLTAHYGLEGGYVSDFQ